MKKLELSTPCDFTESAISGWTRKHWEESFMRLWAPLTRSASAHKARQYIPGPRSHHGQVADELEGFTRSFIMAAPWLSGSTADGFELDGIQYDVAGFYRSGILAGTDPANPEYWGNPVDYAQHLVEMASLSWGLWQSRDRIWERFSEAERRQVASYLLACTKVQYHANNWLLFNVVTNAVLKRFGMPYSQEQLDRNLVFCESMYLGEGWYQDGNVPRIDYYNAWAFHYYYLIWVLLDGSSKPEIAEKHLQRAEEFLTNFSYLMASDGGTPCFGRSEIYRFAFLAPIGLLTQADSKSTGGLYGTLRTMANLGLKWFLTKPVLSSAGHLSLGYVGACADMLEHYSCGGSPYWAAKAFNLLALPAEHPFWHSAEAPLPSQSGSSLKALPAAGFTITAGQDGQTLLLNHKARHDKAEYNDKYTKFAYASAFPYQARHIYGNSDCDAILQFSADGTAWHQRWTMRTLACGELGGASVYPLHEADPEGQASTVSLILGSLIIHLHHLQPTKTLQLREGGFACGSDLSQPLARSFPLQAEHGLGPAEAAIAADNCDTSRISLIRSLGGWTSSHAAGSFAEDRVGANVRYRFSAVPRLETHTRPGQPLLLATLLIGHSGTDSAGQLASSIASAALQTDRGELSLRFADGTQALLRIPEAAGNSAKLAGRTIEPGTLIALIKKNGDLQSLTARKN
ncbi:MAG: DUF2264 domain-containing protein [Spirochaetes bacterium]|nr:DUF2264 domain-containing protein [Spirochaetota bacterium]MBU0956335.1 DUF2264 domain-containing protein [Spirochaetota bacterium]